MAHSQIRVGTHGVPLGVWPLHLSSPARTWTPNVHIEEPLESGSSSHLKCSLPEACDWATPPTISWTGAALRPLGLDSKEDYNSSEILLTPRPQDHGTSLTCRVTFRRASVSAERTVTLNVSCEYRARPAGCLWGWEWALVTPGQGLGGGVLFSFASGSVPPEVWGPWEGGWGRGGSDSLPHHGVSAPQILPRS